MTEPKYPTLAVLIFQDLAGDREVRAEDLPSGIDVNTYCWVRELVKRQRRALEQLGAIRRALDQP